MEIKGGDEATLFHHQIAQLLADQLSLRERAMIDEVFHAPLFWFLALAKRPIQMQVRHVVPGCVSQPHTNLVSPGFDRLRGPGGGGEENLSLHCKHGHYGQHILTNNKWEQRTKRRHSELILGINIKKIKLMGADGS